jgi:hypothetical protein
MIRPFDTGSEQPPCGSGSRGGAVCKSEGKHERGNIEGSGDRWVVTLSSARGDESCVLGCQPKFGIGGSDRLCMAMPYKYLDERLSWKLLDLNIMFRPTDEAWFLCSHFVVAISSAWSRLRHSSGISGCNPGQPKRVSSKRFRTVAGASSLWRNERCVRGQATIFY